MCKTHAPVDIDYLCLSLLKVYVLDHISHIMYIEAIIMTCNVATVHVIQGPRHWISEPPLAPLQHYLVYQVPSPVCVHACVHVHISLQHVSTQYT